MASFLFSHSNRKGKASEQVFPGRKVDLKLEEYADAKTYLPVDASPVSPYPEVPGLPNTYATFYLGQGGLPEERRQGAIAAAKKYLATQVSNLLGNQMTFDFESLSDFASFKDIPVKNGGDPFQEDNSTVNSKFMERAVLDYHAQLWNAKWPHRNNDPESYCGYCLSRGSSEGNLYAMWNGRDYLSGKKILGDDKQQGVAMGPLPGLLHHTAIVPTESKNAYTPIAFCSGAQDSLAKAMTMLDIRTFYAEGQANYPGECPLTDDGAWPAEVPTCDSGAMNIDSLAVLVEFFASRGYPILVCFNYGNNFKGSYDDVSSACAKLEPILEKYGLLNREIKYDEDKGETEVETRTGYWFHVDGALGAAYMPYIEMAYNEGRISEKGPDFDFRLPMVHSISVSDDKGMMASIPSGIYMSRTKYQMLPPDMPEYIGSPDFDSKIPMVRSTSVSDGKGKTASFPSGIYMNRTMHQMVPPDMPEYIGSPDFDSKMPKVQSTAVSDGKGKTASTPSGIYMNRTMHQMGPPDMPEYIGSTGSTVAGSRNGLIPMLHWDNIARHSYEDQVQKAVDLVDRTAYIESRFRHLQDELLKTDLQVTRLPLGIRFAWHAMEEQDMDHAIPGEVVYSGGGKHFVLATEHVTKGLVDDLIENLFKVGAQGIHYREMGGVIPD